MDWETIYRKHAPGVYQYLLNLSGHSPEAEDLLQETFIKAMRAESTLKEPDKVQSWLMTISRNLYLDSLKKQARRKTTSVGDFSEDAGSVPLSQDCPEAQVLTNDFNGKLQKVLGELSETYRTAFTLGILQKTPYREIEEITGWSPAMVKINIFRARKKIASELTEFRG